MFDAKKSSGSYAWQSILKARSVIADGMLWRVGDGSTIRIYWDKWLPGKFPSRIGSPQIATPGDVRVSSLIDQDTKTWDYARIDHLFLPFEAEKIKAIPLCVTHQADYLIWPRSRDGNYSVKTGYDLLWEREQLENASVSDSANKKLFWKRLWKMNVPSKIKNFLWRACSEALPTRSNLAKRKVLDDPTCQLYGSEHENTMHALWSCKNILTVWEANFGWLRKDFPTVVSFSDLVSLVGDHSKRLELFLLGQFGVDGINSGAMNRVCLLKRFWTLLPHY